MNGSERRRKRWAEREESGKCVYCGKQPSKQDCKGCESCCKKKVDTTVRFSKKNKQTTQQYRLLLKHQVIEKYGGVCACCGESQVLFLTIDHIYNDGRQDRQKLYGMKNPPTHTWYFRLRKEEKREDLQVLCFNCNLGKAVNGGECPHKLVKKCLLPTYDKRHDGQFDTRLKIKWPSDDELITMCNTTSIAEVARSLGVHFTAISGRLKRRNKYHLVGKMSNSKKEVRRNFRDACFKRDKYSCIMCDCKSTKDKAETDLDAHHIVSRTEMPNGGYVKENGISLCEECHKKAEEFHSTGVAVIGFSPEELYAKIGSSKEKAIKASREIG